MLSSCQMPQLVTLLVQGIMNAVDVDNSYTELENVTSPRMKSGSRTMTLGNRKKPKFLFAPMVNELFSFTINGIVKLNTEASEVHE